MMAQMDALPSDIQIGGGAVRFAIQGSQEDIRGRASRGIIGHACFSGV